MVFKKRKKGSKLTNFAGRGLVAAPYTSVAEFVKDVDSTYVWDNFLVVSLLQHVQKNYEPFSCTSLYS